MIGLQGKAPAVLQLGEDWIEALTEKDFLRLKGICQPDVRSRMITPHHVYSLESAAELAQKVEQWFGVCDPIQKELSRVAMVEEKLAIFYRLSVEENGEPYTIEQQLYCTVQGSRILQVNLLCSGFQPVATAYEALTTQPAAMQTTLTPNAQLNIETGRGQESTCAILTPAIKRKLNEISSGQVLEVRVDDPEARGDIEAWCRLSGNTLLNLDLQEDQELHFYLMKK